MEKKTVADFEMKPAKAGGKNAAGVENVAKDLSKHFFNNPEAGDTLEGIADWWVARQRRSNAVPIISSALEQLIEEGKVSKRIYGSKELYVSRQ
jgi:hypothetical protein